jgi:hypothetical protein
MLNGGVFDDTAVADQGAVDIGRTDDARGQESGVGIDGSSRFVEAEFRIGVGQA